MLYIEQNVTNIKVIRMYMEDKGKWTCCKCKEGISNDEHYCGYCGIYN